MSVSPPATTINLPIAQQDPTDSDTYEVIHFPGGDKVHVPIPANKTLSAELIVTAHNAAHVTKEYMDRKLKVVEDAAYQDGYSKGLEAVKIACIHFIYAD